MHAQTLNPRSRLLYVYKQQYICGISLLHAFDLNPNHRLIDQNNQRLTSNYDSKYNKSAEFFVCRKHSRSWNHRHQYICIALQTSPLWAEGGQMTLHRTQDIKRLWSEKHRPKAALRHLRHDQHDIKQYNEQFCWQQVCLREDRCSVQYCCTPAYVCVRSTYIALFLRCKTVSRSASHLRPYHQSVNVRRTRESQLSNRTCRACPSSVIRTRTSIMPGLFCHHALALHQNTMIQSLIVSLKINTGYLNNRTQAYTH